MHNNWIANGEHNKRSYQKLLLHRSAHSNNILIRCVMSATWISSSIDDLPHNNCLIPNFRLSIVSEIVSQQNNRIYFPDVCD